MFDCHMLSVKGPNATDNGDYALIDPVTGVFAVADGVSGRPGGARASSVAIRTFVSSVKDVNEGHRLEPTQLLSAISEANRKVRALPEADPTLSGLGTTLSAVVVADTKGRVIHIGDSRVYLFRDCTLSQLTRDHTVTADLVEGGHVSAEGAKRHPLRNMLSRSIGANEEVNPDISEIDLVPGDRFVLATDGLTKALDVDALTYVLRDSEGQDAEGMCRAVMTAALHKAPTDDVTTVIAYFIGAQNGY